MHIDTSYLRWALPYLATCDGDTESIACHQYLSTVQTVICLLHATDLPTAGRLFGSDFLGRLVLQAAHHEPAVRHAFVAIGSLHEISGHQSAVMDGLDKAFAFHQYGLAIKALLLPLYESGERAVDVCLIACILFACFEVCHFISLCG
jgi:hypothetical protein